MEWKNYLKKQKIKFLIHLNKKLNDLLLNVKEMEIETHYPYQFTALSKFTTENFTLERWLFLNDKMEAEVLWNITKDNEKRKLVDVYLLSRIQLKIFDQLLIGYQQEKVK